METSEEAIEFAARQLAKEFGLTGEHAYNAVHKVIINIEAYGQVNS